MRLYVNERRNSSEIYLNLRPSLELSILKSCRFIALPRQVLEDTTSATFDVRRVICVAAESGSLVLHEESMQKPFVSVEYTKS